MPRPGPAELERARLRALAAIPAPGVAWRGRRMRYDPDDHAIEQERQRWVSEKLSAVNDLTLDSLRDPAAEYARHRGNYVRDGDATELALMLEYVR
jgi:hypothetical protein